ncbi:non-hydrolyzing UDP-N-acetylglucosamine 2-epimerase [Vulgatibacter incomptus]|uniref:UDP-N-acetylglucosamine 2-epimerase n=1 Tax=Vulgatibacter incomptus TaxID=1391653 RepID=A0A0K1PFG4_9BACT|nr:UDP-N-acetylglucosamine 2-epimerase (non-hydrolyzing) [Vulgatibacter incomptus]AKU92242.1 UDP-N-acetylglucosamine 2-epimerase [Vulgatibacter incomptus]
MKIVHVVGARPNFMKIAPILQAVARAGFAEQKLVHTGQHYDPSMSDVFFTDLGMPRPDIYMGVGSGSHAEQTAKVMLGFEKLCLEERPNLVVVVGDVNSTFACALVAAKLQIRCAHVEAGLRSGDMRMPEEVNRVLTDRMCELLLTPSRDGDENLLREGTPPERIHFVGNVMIDSLLSHLPRAKALGIPEKLDLDPGGYGVLTLHRPSNVDDPVVLGGLLGAVEELQRRIPIVFPVHPRTRKQLETFGFGPRMAAMPGLRLCEPFGYLEFLGLTSQARLVLTDSGGLQEETTAVGIPCLTLRENTERPVTVTEGTNTVVGLDPARIAAEANGILDGGGKHGRIPALWDGKSSERIAALFRR